MLKHWTHSSKVSCLVITAASLPKNDQERFPDQHKVGWSSLVLHKYAEALEVDMHYLLAYEPLVRVSQALPAETLAMIDPFLTDLKASGFALQYLMELYIFLVTNGFYDARGRVAIRNCVDLLQLSREQYFALEVSLAHALHECEESLARAASAELNKGSTKMKRYLKIGAAGLGAGAVIAFTGGLAAPAVAAALLVIGGSTAVAAAGFATFTVLASVFGTAGAGLAGYKMARRTKGIDEFEFEQYGEKGQLAVTIMVSGWMNEEEDYKRTFGILPSAMTLEEALTRFYMRYDRGRVQCVKAETEEYERNPMALVDQITSTYGMCPLTPANLSAPYDSVALSEQDQELLNRLIRDFVMSSSKKIADRSGHGKVGAQEEDAKIKSTGGSISKSAGRFFKGLLPSTAPAQDSQHPHEEALAAPVPLAIVPEGDGAAVDINTNAPAADSAFATPVLSREQSVPSSTPTVDVHLMASVNSSKWRSLESGEKGISTADEETHHETLDQMGSLDRVSDSEIYTDSEVRYWNWTDLEVAPLYELYLLKWETATQMEIGTSLKQLMKSLQNAVAEKVLMFTAAGLVMSAVALPYTLLKLTDLIDSTWVIALERADAAGKELAEALLNRPQGSRPVTLVGHSIGARLIFSCLIELARRREEDELEDMKHPGADGDEQVVQISDGFDEEEDSVDWAATGSNPSSPGAAAAAALGLSGVRDSKDKKSSRDAEGKPPDAAEDKEGKKKRMGSYGLIQDVVLLGVPVNTNKRAFSRARSIVTGRFVNGYSHKDLCLAFLYRWGAKEALRVAGLQEVSVEGVENVDLSFMIEKHTDYSVKMKNVLNVIDFGRSCGIIEI